MNKRAKKARESKAISIKIRQFYLILAFLVILIVFLAWPRVTSRIPYFYTPSPTVTSTPVPTVTPSPTSTPTTTPSPTATPLPTPTQTPYSYQFSPQFGTLILAIQEGVHSHLFAYSPALKPEGTQFSGIPLLRLTTGSHQDISPSLSPDGSQLAFASDRNGYWDIYIFNLENGALRQFTDSKEYEAYPTWSPDGNWLAYEAYQNKNLEIIIQDLAKEHKPINLTNHPGTDHSPRWSPTGRKISFISTRNGTSNIWIADLDQPTEDKAISLLNSSSQQIKHPSWSPEGRYLTWGGITPTGLHQLYRWDSQNPAHNPHPFANGDLPQWSGNDELLFALFNTAHENYLTAYPAQSTDLKIMLPAVEMPGTVHGMTWGKDIHLDSLLGPAAEVTPTPLWTEVDSSSNLPRGRLDLLPLDTVQAPYPKLNEKAVPSFNELRSTIARKIGWDYLATLDNAFLPLTAPPDPESSRDWLFTGRGIAVNSLPLGADWMVVIKEEYGAQTYWRIYIRTLSQQGNQGRPLHHLPWEFDTQYQGSAQNFERGGSLAESVPEGYWVDFTSIANAYGWKRLPALPRWQTSYSMTRFQTFAFKNGLDWQSAMLEIYPPEALYTPTPDPDSSS